MNILSIKSIIMSKLVLSTGVYTFFSFLNASIPFLLLPVLTTYLSRSDYGIVSMYQTLGFFLLPFITINASAALYRVYFKDKSIVPSYIGNIIIVSSTFFFFFSFLFFLLKKDFSILFEVPERWIITLPIFCFMQLIPGLILVLLQAQVRPLLYGVFQVFQTLINAGVSLCLIISFNFNWEGRIWGILVSYVIGTISGIWLLQKYKQISFNFHWEYIKHLLSFGGGLIFHAIGGYLITLSSRLLLTKFEGLDSTGLYSAAYQIASIVGFLTISFNNAFVPWLFSNLNLNEQRVKDKIVKYTYLYYVVLVFICLLFNFCLEFVYKLFIDSKFNESIAYTRWISIGMLFQGMYYMVTNYISYSEKTYLQTMTTLMMGVLNILLTYVLIHLYGGLGAAISYAVTFFLFFLLSWLISQKAYTMPWFSFYKRRYN